MVAAQTPFPFADQNPNTHGMVKENHPDGRNEIDVTLPYAGTYSFGSSPRLQCTTCHNAHDNSHPPFLQRPLPALCHGCHMKRAVAGSQDKTVRPLEAQVINRRDAAPFPCRADCMECHQAHARDRGGRSLLKKPPP
jgi:predicted CXXCH cytochrome family protein